MGSKKIWSGVLGLSVIVLGLSVIRGSDKDLIPLRVALGARSISKLPFVIAWDQGLYEKHGLDVRLEMPPPDFDGGITVGADGLLVRIWRRLRWQPEPSYDVYVDGGTPYMVRRAIFAGEPRLIALAGTDCVVRAHIVAQPGINNLDELKGKRLGTSFPRATTGFVAFLMAERMGWDPVHDISIMQDGRDVESSPAHGVLPAIPGSPGEQQSGDLLEEHGSLDHGRPRDMDGRPRLGHVVPDTEVRDRPLHPRS